MNDRLTNEEQRAAELALLAGRLGDPSAWAEPRAGLEDAVVQAVVNAPAPADTARKRERRSAPLEEATPATLHALGSRGRRGGRDRLGNCGRGRKGYARGFPGPGSARPDWRPEPAARADVTATRPASDRPRRRAGLPALPEDEYYQAWLRERAWHARANRDVQFERWAHHCGPVSRRRTTPPSP